MANVIVKNGQCNILCNMTKARNETKLKLISCHNDGEFLEQECPSPRCDTTGETLGVATCKTLGFGHRYLKSWVSTKPAAREVTNVGAVAT